MNYGVTVLPKFDADAGQATSILGAMKLYGSFPPKTEAAKDTYWTEDPIQAEFITQLETSIPRGPSAIWPTYSNAIQTGFQDALTLTKTPEQVAEDTQAAVDAIG